MDTNDHIELAHSLNAFQGKALISGYASPLYNRLYKEWNIEKKKIASSKETKVEILWKNY
jgi:site-specific DNA-adenine methylase